MTFIEGLTFIIKNRKDDSEITNPFYLYSRLSDICNETYEDKEKVKIYWKVTSQLNIIGVILEKGIEESLSLLKTLYFEIKNVDFKIYKECVYYSIKALDPLFNFKRKQENKTKEESFKVEKKNTISYILKNILKKNIFIT